MMVRHVGSQSTTKMLTPLGNELEFLIDSIEMLFSLFMPVTLQDKVKLRDEEDICFEHKQCQEREREMLILYSYIVYTVMNTTFKGNLCQTHLLFTVC